MTGFGRGTAERGGLRATVDVRTVNHRFLDLKLRGGPLAPAVEEAVASRVRAAVERGSVTVSVHLAREGAAPSVVIDPAAAEAAYRALADLAARLGMAGPDLALVLAQPGVVVPAERGDEDPPVIPALELALAQLEEMRRTEGAALATELVARCEELSTLRTNIALLAASVPQQVSKRLQERVRRLLELARSEAPLAAGDAGSRGAGPLGAGELASLDPSRLAQEVALLADRSDVTEELVRLSSHLDQARALIATTGAVGRRLEFLVQEIGRELNTIGSKSAHTEISASVVDAKAVLEKIREQIQNVE